MAKIQILVDYPTNPAHYPTECDTHKKRLEFDAKNIEDGEFGIADLVANALDRGEVKVEVVSVVGSADFEEEEWGPTDSTAEKPAF